MYLKEHNLIKNQYKRIPVIYKFTSPSNKSYIGQTINFNKRYSFYYNLKNKKQTHFYNALIKYNISNFKIEILKTFDYIVSKKSIKKILNGYEIYYIKKYKSFKNGYNMTIGGDGTIGLEGLLNKKYNNNKYNFYNNIKSITKFCTIDELSNEYQIKRNYLLRLINGDIKSIKGFSIKKNYIAKEYNKKYTFYNSKFNTEKNVTLVEMKNKYAVNLKSLIFNNKNKTLHGWALNFQDAKKAASWNKKYTFYHIELGIEKDITLTKMSKKYKINKSNLSQLINKKKKSTKGWVINKEAMFKVQIRNKKYTFFNIKTKLTEYLTQSQICKKYNLSQSHISSLINKKRKSHKKWIIIKQKKKT